MSKATHNGTCQACGRVQAVNAKTGLLAKHGYTTDYGFFNGTCGGSDRPPLEIATDLNVQTVAALIEFAVEREAKAEGEITKVPVTIREKFEKRTEWMTREQFEANGHRRFDYAVEQLRYKLRCAAANIRKDAAMLEAMREKVHGQPLQQRKVEAPIQREYFKTYREAFQRVEELKALGHKAQQRRQTGASFAVTYR